LGGFSFLDYELFLHLTSVLSEIPEKFNVYEVLPWLRTEIVPYIETVDTRFVFTEIKTQK
jgi:hypothetical protein